MSSSPDPKRAKTVSSNLSALSTPYQFTSPAISFAPRRPASGTSSRRQHASADSNFAFDIAMKENNFVCSGDLFKDVNLTRIYDNIKLPNTVNDLEFIQWSSRVLGHPIVFADGCFSPNDPHNIALLKQPFFYLWRDHVLAYAAFESRSEMDLRTPIDALIRQAFDTRYREYDDELAMVVYRTEQEMCLPAVPPGTAKANAVVWLPFPSGFNDLFWGLPNAHVFSAESHRRHDMLATFVFEAMFHDKEAASIRPTTTVFNLRLFPNFLKLFVFLCQLADYIHNQVREMGDELEKDEAGFKKRIRDAVREPWRPWKHSSGAMSWQGGPMEGGMDDSMGEGDDDSDDGI
ncbi:hypothetical protein AGABI1DRAFT_131333 [Agaricus bisporus var. burnettii JB137-S8]|uniref:Uncharacterized protein n=1 Tax=Agaricus bisporus var. burnettii (strain JB137-S8 / ATCC MYA-4627 / FGSC 10392) TaxID=597362 RepID=K5WMG5_AGABU|nr:uncharacterized protein AGABI1DRAFT_131333 [Agaricus bisporus var. burnettii JB137-S8]EKM76511.1 hypothetical protein AGABI1DRAFT_131333 [Agaricus bisporus var. burnettii JB137-S8]